MVIIVRYVSDSYVVQRHRRVGGNSDAGVLATLSGECSAIAQSDDTRIRGQGHRTRFWCCHVHGFFSYYRFIYIIPVINPKTQPVIFLIEWDVELKTMVAWNTLQPANTCPFFVGGKHIDVIVYIINVALCTADIDFHIKRIVLIIGVVSPSFHMDVALTSLTYFNVHYWIACPSRRSGHQHDTQ